MGATAAAIGALDPGAVDRYLADGGIELEVQEQTVTLHAQDLDIVSEAVGDWRVAQEGAVTVALDTRITDELRVQGLAREIVNRIQNMRKTHDLELTDRIPH